MQFGDTVDLERSDDGEICHPDVFRSAFLNDRHPTEAINIAWPAFRNLRHKLVIDSVDDLQVPRKEVFEQAELPFLKRLG